MNKTEFEKKFLATLKQKTTISKDCENQLRNYLRFIDNHKIYEYKSYEQLLSALQHLTIQPNANDYLAQSKAVGMFCSSTRLLMLGTKNSAADFIHELTHALSSHRQTVHNCENFKKQTAPAIYDSIYLQHRDFANATEDWTQQEENALVRWYKRNSYLFADTRTSIPTRIEVYSGFRKFWQEFSEYVTPRKLDEKVKNHRDMKKFELGQLGKNFYFDQAISPNDGFVGVSEGTTELISRMVLSYACPDGLVDMYGSYSSQTMLVAQLYATFGESLFEGYFTNTISPLAKKLDLNEEKLADTLKKISNITKASKPEHCEQNMLVVNEVQIDLIKLFERKMLRELAKYKDDFQSPLDMRNAIISAFFDYSKVLHFGIVLEELVNPNFNDVWEQLDRSIKNCVEFGNKLLARRQKPLMNKINPKTLGVFKNQNYLHYDYVGKNMGEITLSNRLAQFDFNFEGPSDECRASATKKQLKTTQVPGEIMFAINNGADQTALYLYALGEDVDEELLKTDFERESEQNNKE